MNSARAGLVRLNARYAGTETVRGNVFLLLKVNKMTRIELLEMLTKIAKEFRIDDSHYSRNAHMHGIKEKPDQAVIDAVLVGFINNVGVAQGIDFCLYASDLTSKQAR